MHECLNLVLAEFIMFDEFFYPILGLSYLIIFYLVMVSL